MLKQNDSKSLAIRFQLDFVSLHLTNAVRNAIPELKEENKGTSPPFHL